MPYVIFVWKVTRLWVNIFPVYALPQGSKEESNRVSCPSGWNGSGRKKISIYIFLCDRIAISACQNICTMGYFPRKVNYVPWGVGGSGQWKGRPSWIGSLPKPQNHLRDTYLIHKNVPPQARPPYYKSKKNLITPSLLKCMRLMQSPIKNILGLIKDPSFSVTFVRLTFMYLFDHVITTFLKVPVNLQ